MMELLNSIQYHLYEYKMWDEQQYSFVFPLDLSNIKDIEVFVPDVFHLKILNNEIKIKILDQRLMNSCLIKKNEEILLKQGRKYNLLIDLVCSSYFSS